MAGIFRHAWTSAREVVRPLLGGALPYVVAIAVVAGLAAFIWFHGEGKARSEASEDALLVEEGVTFDSAYALAQSGDLEGAREQMRGLAPLEMGDRGDLEAHAWLAKDLLGVNDRKGGREVSLEALKEARSRLDRVVKEEHGGREAVELLVGVCGQLGDRAGALEVLESEARRLPELHLLGARLAGAFGNARLQEQHAVSASAHFSRVCEDDGLSREGRARAGLAWAEAEGWLGNFQRMQELVRTLEVAGMEVPRAQALLLQGWMGALRRGLAQDEDASLVRVLGEAISEVGPEAELIELAALLASRKRADASQMMALYERLVAMNLESESSLLPLGSLAVVLGRQGEGLTHLERAVERAPDHLVALNNLGYSLAERGQAGDLERALELLNRAVSLGQERGGLPANCWETRGQILAKMEKWSEAASDLERALVGMPGQVKIHETLGSVYQELGRVKLAEEHRRKAKLLAQESSE